MSPIGLIVIAALMAFFGSIARPLMEYLEIDD